MTTKKKALKGLLILMVVLLVSMFFARTVQTITTAKVKKISATRGRLEDKIMLDGELYFSNSETITLAAARKLSVTVETVPVKPGYFVKTGDTLMTLYIPAYEAEIEKLNETYAAAVRELTVEVAGHLRLPQSSDHNDLYMQTLSAADDYYDKRYEALALAQAAGYDLPPDVSLWGTPPVDEQKKETPSPDATPPPAVLPGAPENIKGAVGTAYAAWLDFESKSLDLRRVYTGNSPIRRTGDGVFDYIKKVDGLREKVDKALLAMLELDKLAAGLHKVEAPRDGYITELALKPGDSYEGIKPAYSLSLEGEQPVIRADITGIKKPLDQGMKVNLENVKQSLAITDIRLSSDGKKYAFIELSPEALTALGGLSKLMGVKTPVTINYKAAQTTTLLPASALRTGSDGAYFVYTIRQEYGGMLGNSSLIVQKQPVTVLETSDRLVALADDLGYMEIADGEDRAIAQGQVVMEYVD